MPKNPPPAPKPAPKQMSIVPAMISIQNDIDAIGKVRKNEAQGFHFRGIDDLYNALHPIFAAHGVLSVPTILESSFGDHGKNAKGNQIYWARVKVQYDFTASDGTKLPAVGVGEAFDFGDKALNKAMSMAHKYVLLQTFQIPTAEPDGDAYTYDTQTAAAEQPDPYAGKTLDQLTILRDEFLEAKQAVPQPLLGRIAELRCEAQDAGGGTGTPAPSKPKTPRANGKAKVEKPAESAPTTVTRPAPATEQDLAPGAIETPATTTTVERPAASAPADDDFSDGGGEDAGAKLAAALEFVVKPEALKHPTYAGRKLSSMSRDEINTLHEKWYLKFQPDIDKTPIKMELRDAILLVKAEWDKQPAPAAK